LLFSPILVCTSDNVVQHPTNVSHDTPSVHLLGKTPRQEDTSACSYCPTFISILYYPSLLDIVSPQPSFVLRMKLFFWVVSNFQQRGNMARRSGDVSIDDAQQKQCNALRPHQCWWWKAVSQWIRCSDETGMHWATRSDVIARLTCTIVDLRQYWALRFSFFSYLRYNECIQSSSLNYKGMK
jgi:hypothetical protein